MSVNGSRITDLCELIAQGDDAARNRLFVLVYSELYQMAHALRCRHGPNHQLETGDLVSEMYFKLVAGNGKALTKNRRYFFGAAALAIRGLLYRRPVSLLPLSDDVAAPPPPDLSRFRALDRALDDLLVCDGLLAELVQMRIFCGKTIKETAEILKIGTMTVSNKWTTAKAFLEMRIEEHLRHGDSDQLGTGLSDF
jgi:RNA polymerase sigma factor (TIGR02999 family)